MKKYFLYLVVATLALLLVSCDNMELKKMIRETNKICPIRFSEWMTIDKVDYTNNTVTLTYTIDDDLMDFDYVRANEKAFRDNMLITFANNNGEDFRKMIDAIIDAKANLDVVYKNNSGDNYTMHVTLDDLKANRPGASSDPERMLKATVDIAKSQTPQVVEEGMVMTDVNLDKMALTYVYICDETVYDIDLLQENSNMVKESMLEELDNDPLFKPTINLLIATNRQLLYKYVGSSSGKSCSISINPMEI